MRRSSIHAAATRVSRFAQRPLVTPLVFVALSVAVYWRVLDGWFLSDDCTLSFVVPDGENVAWGHVLRVFGSDWVDRGEWATVRYYRPIVILSQALDAFVWGAEPTGFHLTNVGLHGANGFLLHRLARSIRATPATSWFAAVLFVVFPWNGESVAWISGRTDVLCTTFELTTLLLYVRSRSALNVRRRAGLLFASLAAFTLALGSKEPAIALPALIFAADVVLGSPERSPWRRFYRPAAAWLAFGAVAVGYLWVRKQALGTVWGGGEMTFSPARSEWLSRIARNGTDNLALLVMPYNRVTFGGHEPIAYWSYVVGYAALALAALGAARRGGVPVRPILLSLVWTLASAAPFIIGAHVELDLQSSRFLYFTSRQRAPACYSAPWWPPSQGPPRASPPSSSSVSPSPRCR